MRMLAAGDKVAARSCVSAGGVMRRSDRVRVLLGLVVLALSMVPVAGAAESGALVAALAIVLGLLVWVALELLGIVSVLSGCEPGSPGDCRAW